MIKDTLTKIEDLLKKSTAPDEIQKTELQNLFAKLKSEVLELSKEHSEHKDFSTLETLSSSLEEFEVSHPKFVAALNSISTTLSNMGI